MTRMHRGLVLEEACTARSRSYPVTVAYTTYALAVATVALRDDGGNHFVTDAAEICPTSFAQSMSMAS